MFFYDAKEFRRLMVVFVKVLNAVFVCYCQVEDCCVCLLLMSSTRLLHLLIVNVE